MIDRSAKSIRIESNIRTCLDLRDCMNSWFQYCIIAMLKLSAHQVYDFKATQAYNTFTKCYVQCYVFYVQYL